MRSLFKLGLVVMGFTLATLATTGTVKAAHGFKKEVAAGGCYGSGTCGFTREGTALVGKWRE